MSGREGNEGVVRPEPEGTEPPVSPPRVRPDGHGISDEGIVAEPGDLGRVHTDFAAQIDALGRRLAAMHRHALALQHQADRTLHHADEHDVVEDLLAALEELHVAQEELLVQHHEIGTSRMAVELERQRYVELFEFAPDAYLVTGIDGTIREANRAAADLLGVAQSRLRGKPIISFVDEPSKRELRRLVLSVAESTRDDTKSEKRELGIVVRPRRGSGIDVSAALAAVRDRDGRCVGLRWLLRDVSDRARVEREVRRLNDELERRVVDRTAELELRTRELEIASSAKSTFLAVMSHELRTPLQAVLGFADLMRTDIPDSLPEYARKWADYIHRAAEHLLSLVEQILRFSRLEAGREIVHPERVDLDSLVRELVLFVEPAARIKGLDLQVKVSPESAAIITDLGKLRQILFNLLANAIKFTEHGEVVLDVHTVGDRAILTVRDTGIGIAPDHLERVFDQFWQAECRPTSGKGGTGLGLAIARHLARLLGGDITVQSTLSSGSLFSVDIAADLTAVPAAPV